MHRLGFWPDYLAFAFREESLLLPCIFESPIFKENKQDVKLKLPTEASMDNRLKRQAITLWLVLVAAPAADSKSL
jgi:hypothetical protein